MTVQVKQKRPYQELNMKDTRRKALSWTATACSHVGDSLDGWRALTWEGSGSLAIGWTRVATDSFKPRSHTGSSADTVPRASLMNVTVLQSTPGFPLRLGAVAPREGRSGGRGGETDDT